MAIGLLVKSAVEKGFNDEQKAYVIDTQIMQI